MIVLVDTGPLVAYLDRKDPAHLFVASKWQTMRGRLITTGAVLTEAMHFLAPIPNGARALSDLFSAGALVVEDAFHPARFDRAVALMERYANVPMDFADATLVVVAERLDAPDISTLDERGFRTFRYNRNNRFRLMLQDGAWEK